MNKAPWHLWTVGIVTLLWNAMGAYDYLMTQTRNEAYMGKYTAEALEYFYGMPTWAESTWAIAIWGSVLGSVLLLLRRCWAAPVFFVSLLSVIATSIYSYGLSEGLEIMGVGGLIFSIVILVLAVFEWLYARAMCARKVLR